MLKNKKICFIGGGQMSQAIFSGLILAGAVLPGNIFVVDVDESRLAFLSREYKLKTALNNSKNTAACKMAKNCDITILALKPLFAQSVLKDLGASFGQGSTVISIMGAVQLKTLQAAMPQTAVLRVMPNTPMLVGKGCAAIAPGKNADENHLALCRAIFNALGTSAVLPEELMNAFTAVGGCGPAFAYLFIEALADGGVKQGLARGLATEVAAQTLLGAAQMVLQTKTHPAQLKDNVCSAGGGTIAGVQALEKAAFRGTVMQAVEDSKKRMDELGGLAMQEK